MDCEEMSVMEIVEGIKEHFEDPYWMRTLYDNKCFHKIGSYLLLIRHKFSVEVGFLFLQGIEHAATLKLLDRYEMVSPELIREVHNEIIDIKGNRFFTKYFDNMMLVRKVVVLFISLHLFCLILCMW
jgi:hypothetical protein